MGVATPRTRGKIGGQCGKIRRLERGEPRTGGIVVRCLVGLVDGNDATDGWSECLF